ncbi:MAG: hypothetical protein ACYDCK_12870 [Thermoplasmatota archaeon]
MSQGRRSASIYRARRTFALAALGLAAGTIVVALFLSHHFRAQTELVSIDAGGILVFHSGDKLTYEIDDAGSRAEFDVRILGPREVAGPNFSRSLGLPMLGTLRTTTGETSQAYVIDIRTGATLLSTDACFLDSSVPCQNPGSDAADIEWQDCPLVGALFQPIVSIPRSATSETTFTLKDPLEPSEWTYSIQLLDSNHLQFALMTGPTDRTMCHLLTSFRVDLSRGLLESAGAANYSFRLLRVDSVAGPEIIPGGARIEGGVLASPDARRTGPFPPGAEEYGPAGWSANDAWSYAAANCPALTDFLSSHHDAFVYKMTNASGRAEVLPGSRGQVTQEFARWSFQVLATDRTMVQVDADRNSTSAAGVNAGHPSFATRCSAMAPPSSIPAFVIAPRDSEVSVTSFVQASALHGFAPPGIYRHPSIAVLFDGTRAHYFYILNLAATKVVGGTVSTQDLMMNADTGRLFDGKLSREAIASLVAGNP